MNRASVLALAGLSACAALDVPPEETPYFVEQLALARATPAAGPSAPEAAVLRDAAASLDVRAAAETARIRRGDETEALLDVESRSAREFLAKLADPEQAAGVLAATALDIERALLAAYARNPEVAAARANWTATVRSYEQATYLEDVLLRYSAFTRLATPGVGAAPMRESAFPYPGVVALRGEMIDREAAIARETARMRLRDVVVATAKAWHVAVHHGEELRIRDAQFALAKRAAEATRARVESGKSPQAELLEMEAEVAMAENEREHAMTSLARARAELNTLLDRDPHAPLTLHPHGHADPPEEAALVEPLLAMARLYAPEIRIARAETARSAAAIRMSEATLLAAPAPGAIAPGAAGASTLPAREEPPAGAPAAFGPDVAWIAGMRERHVALERDAEESVRAVERRVLAAHSEMEAMRRAYRVASKTTEPLAAQAVEERLRLYESGRGEFADLAASLRRRLAAAHDAIAARHDYFMQRTMLWMAVGARPEVVRGAGGGDTN